MHSQAGRVFAAVVIGLTLVARAQSGGGPPPAVVRFDAARTESIEQWREVTGELLAVRRSKIASRQGGQLRDLLVDDGDHVKAGQEIARLDDALQTLSVAEAQAAVEARHATVGVRQSELDRAARDWARYESLQGNASVSKTEIDAAQSAVRVGEAALAQARAEEASATAVLASARERLSQRVIRAPFDGQVWQKLTQVGQWVSEGDPVVDVVDLSKLEARLDVPERLAVRLREGSSRVRVKVHALGTELTGVVQHLMPGADNLSRLLPVRVLIDNPEGTLRPGLRISGLVASGENAPTLTIHKDAILRDDAGEFVYWNANGAAVPARIRTLFGVGDRVAVSASIPPGAEVIVQGNERIMFPGQPVIDPTKPAPAAQPPASAPGH